MLERALTGLREAEGSRITPVAVRVARLLRLIAHLLYVWLASLVVLRWLGRHQRDAMLRSWAAQMLEILNVQVTFRGPSRSSAPRLVIANHISWLDMYVLSYLGALRFVTKAEVARWPLFGTLARRMGCFFIVRGNFRDAMRVKNIIAACLREGEPVAVFPEGTTGDGSYLGYFYPALLQAAVDAEVNLQPVAIRYPDPHDRPNKAAAYLDEISLFASVAAILREPMLRAEVVFCEPLGAAGSTRKELTGLARRQIAHVLRVSDNSLQPRKFHRIDQRPEQPGLRSRFKKKLPWLSGSGLPAGLHPTA